jgi:DNA-binding FrmR family transcriptional regulator
MHGDRGEKPRSKKLLPLDRALVQRGLKSLLGLSEAARIGALSGGREARRADRVALDASVSRACECSVTETTITIIAMFDEDPYVLDVLRQLAAVRGALDATVWTALRHYFEHTFVRAVKAGQSEAVIDELMAALTFLKEID